MVNGARKRGSPRQRRLDTHKGYASGATIRNIDDTPEIERDGEELPRLSPGVGCDSTPRGDKVTVMLKAYSRIISAEYYLHVTRRNINYGIPTGYSHSTSIRFKKVKIKCIRGIYKLNYTLFKTETTRRISAEY